MSLKNLERSKETKLDKKTLRNISILVIIVSILTACGQIAKSLPNQVGLSPLSGEATPSSIQNNMLSAINSVRTQGTTCDGVFLDNAYTISWNEKLAGAAKTQVKDILNRVSSGEINLKTQAPPHTDSTGGRVDNRVDAQDYNFKKVGEILASVSNGSAAINSVIKAWQASPSHCKEMMKSRFEEVGIYFESGLWAVVFGDPK